MLVLKEIESSEFNLIYADMKMQFPAYELKSFSSYINLLKTGFYSAYKLLDSEKDIGYVLLYKDNKKNILWLDYFAIYKNFQSQGYGSKILRLLKEEFQTFNGIYLEVEKPDKHDNNTFRRIKFYKNHGAERCLINYIYPNEKGGFHMDLYFLPFQETMPDKKVILSDVKEILYTLHHDIPDVEKIISMIN